MTQCHQPNFGPLFFIINPFTIYRFCFIHPAGTTQHKIMNVEELSMIGPDVDLQTVDAINKKRLLAFINSFIINTSLFLNKLSKSCEHGLMSLENKIQKLETSLIILESKLNSVSGLEVKESTDTVVVPNVEVKQDKAEEINNENKEEKGEEEEEGDGSKGSQKELDPALLKYVKMIQFGVPLPAVRFKMEQEGVDSSLHDLVLNYNK